MQLSQKDQLTPFNDLARQCDLLLKSGEIHQVRNRMSQLPLAKVPREARAALAKICRRAGLINQGLRLLHPIVRHQKEREEPASPFEICEYSVLLSRNGSVAEALTLLDHVDSSKVPDALLYKGLCYILNWEYERAVHYFQEFLELPVDEYSKLIAHVNLASSFVVLSRLKEADQVLNQTIELAQKLGANRLIGNCYELRGQVLFWQEKYPEARQILKKALEILGSTRSHDRHLIEKTEAIMRALESKSAEPLLRFREEALKEKLWESVREADLFLLKVQFNQKNLDHLIFGTPLKPYRDRIRSVVGHPPSETFVLGSEEGICLDLLTGQMKGDADLLPGRKVHRVLSALTKDFYVPRNIGQLFADLYPGEYYNVDTSPTRVRQLIKRARVWLAENRIEASILYRDGTYRFSIEGEFGLRFPLEASSVDFLEIRLFELSEAFGHRKFTARQACAKLNWSRSTFQRLSDWALEHGSLQKTGINRSTQYQISSTRLKAIHLKSA